MEAELLVPSLELEDVTFTEATVSGPIVWCTFKNFLSVTFIFEEEKKSPGISLLRLIIHFIYFSNSRGANISLAQCKGHQRRGPVGCRKQLEVTVHILLYMNFVSKRQKNLYTTMIFFEE